MSNDTTIMWRFVFKSTGFNKTESLLQNTHAENKQNSSVYDLLYNQLKTDPVINTPVQTVSQLVL